MFDHTNYRNATHEEQIEYLLECFADNGGHRPDQQAAMRDELESLADYRLTERFQEAIWWNTPSAKRWT